MLRMGRVAGRGEVLADAAVVVDELMPRPGMTVVAAWEGTEHEDAEVSCCSGSGSSERGTCGKGLMSAKMLPVLRPRG